MGRKPNQLISNNFERGEKLANSSNRYSHTCIHCRKIFPKGRPEVLTSHLSKCPALSPNTRIAILNEPDLFQPVHRADHDSNYGEEHNVGLQRLADVAEAAGAVSVRVSLSDDRSIPLDPQLGGAGTDLVSEPGDHGFYAQTTPFTTSDYGNYPTTSSIYPSLSSPPLSSGIGQYPILAGLPTTAYPNAFVPYSGSEQVSVSQTGGYGPVDPSTDFNVFAHNTPVLPSIASPLPIIDPAFAPDTDNLTSDLSAKSDSRSRKAKEPYTPDKRKKIHEMRRFRPCIRCSRLQKSCSSVQPCDQCVKVQSNKNWVGPCSKFKKSNDFDEWYQPILTSELTAMYHHISENFTPDEGTTFRIEIYIQGIASNPIFIDATRVINHKDNVTLYMPNKNSNFKDVIKSYLYKTNDAIEAIVSQIQPSEIAMTLQQAFSLTKGQKPTLSSITHGQTMKGDENLLHLIELWIAVNVLCSSPWTINLHEASSDNVVPESSLDKAFSYIRQYLAATMEGVIADTRTEPTSPKEDLDEPDYGGVLHDFDISRVSSSSHREFPNLLLGMVIVLSAVERFCAFTRARVGNLPADYREKAEEYARKYVYAVRGVSILPPLRLQQDQIDATTLETKYEILSTGRNQGSRTLDYTFTKQYVDSLGLSTEALDARIASIDLPWDDNLNGWDGWLWCRIFRSMVE